MSLILAAGSVLVPGACDIEDKAKGQDAVVQTAAPNTPTAPTTTAASAAEPTPEPDDATAVRMPDVMCMDLQYAQDTIQDAGAWLSSSVDATGEGRIQVMDRNRTVVAQTPAPGTPIGEGEALLSVVEGRRTERLLIASPSTPSAPFKRVLIPPREG